jgi:hypothetical protein
LFSLINLKYRTLRENLESSLGLLLLVFDVYCLVSIGL